MTKVDAPHQRIRNACALLGLTYDSGAALLGRSRRTYRCYLIGETEPALSSLTALVERGISSEYLLTGRGPILGVATVHSVADSEALAKKVDAVIEEFRENMRRLGAEA